MIRWLLGGFWFVTLSLGLNMAASELWGYGTRAGRWFVRQWVRLLPLDQRDRWREEWEADVTARGKGPDGDGDHHLTAMAWGFWTLRAAVIRSRLVSRWAQNPRAEQLVSGLVYGLVCGLLHGLLIGLVYGPPVGLGSGLLFGLIYGLCGLLGSLGHERNRELVGGLSFGLVSGLFSGQAFGMGFGLVGGLGFGLVFGLGEWVSVRWGRSLVGWAYRRR